MQTNIKNKQMLAKTIIGLTSNLYELAMVRYQVNGFSDDRKAILSIPDITINKDNYLSKIDYISNIIVNSIETHNQPNDINIIDFQVCPLNNQLAMINAIGDINLSKKDWHQMQELANQVEEDVRNVLLKKNLE